MSAILPATDDPDSAAFWEAAREGQLVVQKLANGQLSFPPRSGQVDATWQAVSGRGKIWSFVVVHGPTLPAYADAVPFVVAVVQLDEDEHLRMVGNLVASPGAAINSVSPDSIAIGQAVLVSFEKVADDVFLPSWVPVS